MSNRSRYEDLTTLLYLVPFVGSVGYAAVLWAETGASLTLPTSVFLTVTRDPYLFVAASLAVLFGIVVEVNGTAPVGRPARLTSLGGTTQSIAIGSLVISLLSAWYANGFTNIGGAASDFMVGRYDLVFPAIMVLLSYLLTARFRFQALADRSMLGVIAMLLVIPTLYEIGKRQIALGGVISLALMVLGVFLLLPPRKKAPAEKDE